MSAEGSRVKGSSHQSLKEGLIIFRPRPTYYGRIGKRYYTGGRHSDHAGQIKGKRRSQLVPVIKVHKGKWPLYKC